MKNRRFLFYCRLRNLNFVKNSAVSFIVIISSVLFLCIKPSDALSNGNGNTRILSATPVDSVAKHKTDASLVSAKDKDLDLVYDWTDSKTDSKVSNIDIVSGVINDMAAGETDSKLSWKSPSATTWTTTYTSPVCAGTSQTITFSATGMGLGYIQVSTDGSNYYTGTQINTGALAAGTYNFYGRIVDYNYVYQTVTITVSPQITGLTAGATPNPICSGSTLSLSASSTAGSPSAYSWSSSGAWTGSGQYPTVSPTTSTTYTVTASNAACTATATTGLVTVYQLQGISLSSGNNNQGVCINHAIANITYNLSGSATDASVANLPAGVGYSTAGTVFTISGTPTVAGTFNYTVTTTGTGNCSPQSPTGTLTVTDNSYVTLSGGSGPSVQSLCANAAITPITYNVTGNATGATIAWTLNGASVGTPAGLTASYSGGVFTISGNPSVGSAYPYIYTITATNGIPNCNIGSAGGQITVNPNQSLTWDGASGNPSNQTPCINDPITAIRYTVGGGGTGVTVSGLPAGVTYSYSAPTLTISGTPTVSGTFPFTVTTSGTCTVATTSGSITVGPNAAIVLTSGNPTPAGFCVNTPLSVSIVYTLSGGATGAGATGLPAGISGVYNAGAHTFTISGTPSVSAGSPYNYIVTTTGTCSQTSATGTITVYAAPAIIVQPINPTATCLGSGTQVISVGATGYNITYDWQMLSGSWISVTNGGVYSGQGTPTLTLTNPTGVQALHYRVVVNGGCSSAPNSAATSNEAIVTVNTCPVTICPGYNLGFATYAPGQYGSGTPVDQWEVSIDGGSTWSSYTPPNPITTTNGTGSVQVHTRRTSTGPCSTLAWSTPADILWYFATNPISPTLGSCTPANGSAICAGTFPTATGAGGSGGSTGAANIYQVIIDGGTPVPYTPGTPINTTGALHTVIVQAARTAGLYSGNNGCVTTAWTTICSWNIIAVTVASLQYPAPGYFCTNAANATTSPTLGGVGTGSFSASPAGLNFVSTTTGQINLLTSDPGTYLVTYTVVGTCNTSVVSQSITIYGAPTATISYTGTPFCTSAGPQTVNLTGTYAYTGGTFSSSPAGLSIAAGLGATGTITPASSTPGGPYTISYTMVTDHGCVAQAAVTTTVSITGNPTASITYSGSPWCSTLGSQPVTLNGTYNYGSGTYTSTAGLAINLSTGAILPGSSTGGTYTVTYTGVASGGCAAPVTTTSVIVTPYATANISYAGSPYCTSLSTAQGVTLTGTNTFGGGTYSVVPATGLTINGSGAVTPSTSTAGTYDVTYTIPVVGGCGAHVASTTSVVITTLPVATFSYTGTPYCSDNTDPLPTYAGGVPGAFSSSPAGLVFLSTSTGQVSLAGSTANTYSVTNTIAASAGCAQVAVSSPITINPASTIHLTSAVGTDAQTKCDNVAITPITYSTTVATGISASGLPPGVNAVWAGNVVTISGTPNTPGTYNYTINLTGSACNRSTTGSISVTPPAVAGTATAAVSPICAGATTSVNLVGSVGQIQWQTNASGSWADISGATSATYTTPYLAVSTSYQAVLTLPGCATVTSSVAAVALTYPSTSGLTSGDHVWLGGQSDDWGAAANWLEFSNPTFIATSEPAALDNVYIMNLGACAANAVHIQHLGETCYNLNIANSCAVNFNAGSSLLVYGDIINNGSINAGTGLINICGGGTVQNIKTNGSSLYDLTINKPAGNVSLSDNATIGHLLTMTQGDILTGTYTLSFTTNASNPALTESATSKIIGNAFMQDRNVGCGATLNFLGLNIASGVDNLGAVNLMRVSGPTGICTFNTYSSIACNWFIHPTNQPVSGRDMTFQWLSAFDNGKNFSTDQAEVWKSDPPLPWHCMNVAAMATPGALWTSPVVHAILFSDWTVSTKTAPLPVELINFYAKCVNDRVNLNWLTASETNNNYFTIERSKDFLNFEKVLDYPGAGSSNNPISYSAIDPSPYEGSSYYRLMQTDYDGTFTYSNTVPVNCDMGNEFDLISAISGDQNHEILLTFTAKNGELYNYSIYDITGQLIMNKSDYAVDGFNQIHINLGDVAEGLFVIVLQSDEKSFSRKIILK